MAHERLYGLEIEMPVIDAATGESRAVQDFFQTLIRLRNGESSRLVSDCAPAVEFADGTVGLDNAYNNIECALGPFETLGELAESVRRALAYVERGLAEEGLAAANLSQHPAMRIDRDVYLAMRCPKPIYDYWNQVRGWNHAVGVDAKAHNGPTTQVSPHEAVDALNTMLGLAPAFIGLFAGSPFEAGVYTGRLENRLTIWERMFARARHRGDRKLCVCDGPFDDLAAYFRAMYGPGTAMQYVPGGDVHDYKLPDVMFSVEGDPCLLDFLAGTPRPARNIRTGETILAAPDLSLVGLHQFVPFLDARIRFRLADETGSPGDFLAALDAGGAAFGRWFAQAVSCCYIEGRVAGAVLPDREVVDAAGSEIGLSAPLSPSALQAGLLAEPDRALALVGRVGWDRLAELRARAILRGLDAEVDGWSVRRLCGEVLELAGAALPARDQWMLGYAQWVLARGDNAARRSIATYETATERDPWRRLLDMARARRMVLPE